MLSAGISIQVCRIKQVQALFKRMFEEEEGGKKKKKKAFIPV